tara:strand:+ start:3031 stop:4401 length:1371 start_codon:yes stop_codon:yes gene_type:complete
MIFRILISYITFLVLIINFNSNNSDRLTSFLFVFFAAIISILILGRRGTFKYGFNVSKYFIIGFTIKIVIGFLFWEFYLFPDYFSINTSKIHFDHFEYLYTNMRMEELANYRLSYGIFSFPIEEILRKSIYIHYLMSNIYLSGSFNIFDIAIQNSLFSIFTTLIITHIVKLEGGSSKQIKLALLLTIFLPMSLISTMIWRDVVGQFFVALGGYILYKSIKQNKVLLTEKIILFVLASLSMYMQRYVYAFFPVITIGIYYLFISRNKKTLFFLFPILVILIIYFDNLFLMSTHLTESYGSNIKSITFWALIPFNIIRMLIGPFPWTNWFDFNDNSIFLIGDYLQSVVNISLVIFLIRIIVKNKKLLKTQSMLAGLSNSSILFLILTSLFVFVGLGTVEIHISYFSTGIIFLIPIICLSFNNKNILTILLRVFLFFIVTNLIFFIVDLGGMGIGNFLR